MLNESVPPAAALPTLPGCGRPATTRIEMYSPRETLHGSLDGSVYTCREHTDPARYAISAAGMAPYLMPHSAGTWTRCGDGYDFLAGRPLNAPVDPSPVSAEVPAKLAEGGA